MECYLEIIGILGQAGNAKTQTDVAQEKEIIDLAVVGAMGKSKYGDIDETSFTSELEKNNATVTKSGSKYKVAFTSGRQYTVDSDGNVKEKNPNELEIEDIKSNANKYFGYEVLNYETKAGESVGTLKWQVFYVGKIDEDDANEENHIYLIAKDYVENQYLPTVIKNSQPIENAKPTAGDNNYKASFSGVISQYRGSSDITNAEVQKLNSSFFQYLIDNRTTRSSDSMKAVSYMLDTITWSKFKGETSDYAIGGPTIEILCKAYNKYSNKPIGETYEVNGKNKNGYKVSVDGGKTYNNTLHTNAIVDDSTTTDNPYSVYNSNNALGYWIASPYYNSVSNVLGIDSNGTINAAESISSTRYGFRPLIRLNSNIVLEKTKDNDGNDAFKIVEQ